MWSFKEKYTVSDEDGDPLIYVERPRHLTAGCLALFAGLLVMGVIIGGAVFAGQGLKGGAPLARGVGEEKSLR